MVDDSYHIIIKNGKLIDPYQKIEEKRDLAIINNKVATVEEKIPSASGKKIIDAAGKIVIPGIIDLHTHVFDGINLGIDPNMCLLRGTTTMVDAGTAGCNSFTTFRKYIIEMCKPRVVPLLHISSIGLIKGGLELIDIRELQYEKAIEVARANEDMIKGFKIRFASPPRLLGKSPPRNHVGNNGPVAMRMLRQAADETGGLVMIHPKSITPGFGVENELKLMREGDIFTHCFAPPYPYYFPHGEILDSEGHVLPVVKEAARRGVVFDVGHGAGSFSFQVAEKAIEDGFLPTTISTDIHKSSLKTARDMPTTMSKFLALGVPLSKVVKMSTTKPAEIIGFEGNLGTLKPGAEADVTILNLEKGKFTFEDVRGVKRTGCELLSPYAVIKGGDFIPLH